MFNVLDFKMIMGTKLFWDHKTEFNGIKYIFPFIDRIVSELHYSFNKAQYFGATYRSTVLRLLFVLASFLEVGICLNQVRLLMKHPVHKS